MTIRYNAENDNDYRSYIIMINSFLLQSSKSGKMIFVSRTPVVADTYYNYISK